jgi:acyl-CoA synthetase (NDP forming)
MVRKLRSYPLLEGYRGSQASDIAALEDVLLRVSALVEDHPEIAELDCNPVIVSASGAVIVDSRVRVSMPTPRRPISARG